MKPSKIFCFIWFVGFFLISLFQQVYCQEGSPFLTTFTSDDASLNENYSICQDANGVMIIANRKGILTFDADEWRLVKTPELPLVVASEPGSSIIFVGCRNNIGYLKKNLLGEYEFVSLASLETGSVTQILFHKNYFYFLSTSNITRINLNKYEDREQWKSKTDNPFLSLFVLNSKVWIDIFQSGLHNFNGNKLEPVLNTGFSLNGRIVFALPYDDNALLIGGTDNKLYLFNGKELRNFSVQDQPYLNEGTITDGKLLDNDKIVISTATSGCLVIEKKTGKTIYSINYQSGLPDDEVLALGTDNNHGIWIAHYYGLTRVDAGIPVKNFSTYKGLSGNLQSIEFQNGKLFVAGSNGVYFLDKRKDYVEYNIKAPQTIASTKVINKNNKSKEENIVESQPKEQKRGFFSKLFGKKNKTEEGTGISEITGKIENKEISRENKLIEKKAYKLMSVSHTFFKVNGFEHRCRQLVNFNGHLLAATISGVYEITESNAIPVLPGKQINYIFCVNNSNTVYACTDNGVIILQPHGKTWQTSVFPVVTNEPVYSFAKDVFDNYWLGCENKTIRVKLKKDMSIKESKIFTFPTEYRERIIVRISNKKPLFFNSLGIYSIFNDSIQPNIVLMKYFGTNTQYFFSQQEYTWINNNGNWIGLSATSEVDTTSVNYLNLFDNINHIYSDNSGNLWIINDNMLIYKVNKQKIAEYKSDFSAFIKSFTGLSGEPFSLYGVKLDKNNHSLKIRISAPYFVKRNSNQYQYYVEGIMNNWSAWSSNPIVDLLVVKAGNYKLKVRARNIFRNISNEQVLNFSIKPAFYETWWFICLCVMFGIFLIYLFIKYRERKLLHENEILEAKVKERTKQIAEQKEEIEVQRDALAIQNLHITKQKEEIEVQRNKIALQNHEITDSIYYAKRLQNAVMTDDSIISNLLSDYFVVFRPKDIVSGDFYWVNKKNGKLIIAAADCTGHGVPGGFLSMLGISFLNEITAADRDYKANELLNILKARLKGTLIKHGHEDETKDGMDIALCIIDIKQLQLQYAGANNPLYLVRNNELIEYHADKMPIGAFIGEKESFTNNDIKMQKNDLLYIFSDGYKDQLGGTEAKRLKSNAFRKLLLDVHSKSMRQQKETLEKFFDEWKGAHEQVDDIMIFGIKI
jgi:serine phosphatase RsbU (regulator of sigma subunit)/ligand-binding sensor domain-containing protein